MAWTNPKTDWADGDLVSASDMNAVGENLMALRQPSKSVAVHSTSVGYSRGASHEFTDVSSDNLNLAMTTAGGDVLVHFHGTMGMGQLTSVALDIEVDGSRLGGSSGILVCSPRYSTAWPVSLTRLIQNLNAGSHTFKLQWKSNDVVRLGAGAHFLLREI
ncbi:MAG: hypothetical protein OXG39_18205 [Chloroflexi bacterium]|nr:hypothetical protein [Chloroflexota bacterium]